MKKILISWIGATDLRAPTEADTISLDQIAQAVSVFEYSEVVLISDYPKENTISYIKWLEGITPSKIDLHQTSLSSPTNFGDILAFDS